MISRRCLLGMPAGFIVPGRVSAQEPVRTSPVRFTFIVTDSRARYVNGLTPSDFRVFEDGVPQKILIFSEGRKAALAVNDDGNTTPLTAANSAGVPGIDLQPQFPADGEVDNLYSITYTPPADRKPGFHKIDVQVLHGTNLRVRKRAGYRLAIP
jgi:hypothetical protein